MLPQLITHPNLFLLWAVALILAITIHEFAHAWAADRLGDPTPRLQGRLTLNPLAHLDPIGTLAILLVGFGWGRPVQFDPFNLRRPRRDAMLISLAGPLSNLILAVVLALLLRFNPGLISLITPILFLNVALAVFNLVPVHPLDGEKILTGLLPASLASEFDNIMRQYGTLILIFLILPLGGTSPISRLIAPVIDFLTHLLI